MAKVIIRETIISLLVCLAVLLILSVALYNYIPANKVVPETVEYTPSTEIKAQLNAEVEDNSSEILMTYEVTASDLDNFERTNEYNPGKANPFSIVSSDPVDTGNGDDSGNTGSTGGSSSGNSNGGTSGNGSGGSLFENPSSK